MQRENLTYKNSLTITLVFQLLYNSDPFSDKLNKLYSHRDVFLDNLNLPHGHTSSTPFLTYCYCCKIFTILSSTLHTLLALR